MQEDDYNDDDMLEEEDTSEYDEAFDAWYENTVYAFVDDLVTYNQDLFPGYEKQLFNYQNSVEVEKPALIASLADNGFWLPIELKKWIYHYCIPGGQLDNEPEIYPVNTDDFYEMRFIQDEIDIARGAAIRLSYSEPYLFPDLEGSYGMPCEIKYPEKIEYMKNIAQHDKPDNPELVRALRSKAFWKQYKEWLKAGRIEPYPWEGFKEAPEHGDDIIEFYLEHQPKTEEDTQTRWHRSLFRNG